MTPTPHNGFNRRWKEIKTIWQQNQWLYGLAGFLLGLLAFPALQRVVDNPADVLGDLLPEAAGIAFTVFFIDRLYQRREEERLKQQLIREMGSTSNTIALRAVSEIRAHGWLTDGSLTGKYFAAAALQSADLRNADLRDAEIWSANLQGANLFNVNLEGANLAGTDLQSVLLLQANLRGTQFGNNQFDHSTILPDGTHWTPDTDLRRFTDLTQPSFWRSPDADSPTSQQPT